MPQSCCPRFCPQYTALNTYLTVPNGEGKTSTHGDGLGRMPNLQLLSHDHQQLPVLIGISQAPLQGQKSANAAYPVFLQEF